MIPLYIKLILIYSKYAARRVDKRWSQNVTNQHGGLKQIIFITKREVSFVVQGTTISRTTHIIIAKSCYCDKHYDHTSLIEASSEPTQAEINYRLPLIHIHPKKLLKNNLKTEFIIYFIFLVGVLCRQLITKRYKLI